MKVRAIISFRINEGKFRRGTFLRFLGRQRTYNSKSSEVLANNGVQSLLSAVLAKEGIKGWFWASLAGLTYRRIALSLSKGRLLLPRERGVPPHFVLQGPPPLLSPIRNCPARRGLRRTSRKVIHRNAGVG